MTIKSIFGDAFESFVANRCILTNIFEMKPICNDVHIALMGNRLPAEYRSTLVDTSSTSTVPQSAARLVEA